MSDNVLNQLRNKRNRPTVTPRQDALLRREQPQAQPQEQNSLPQPTPVTELANSTAAHLTHLQNLKPNSKNTPKLGDIRQSF